MREGRLGYNSSSERYGILLSDLWIDTGLHCGECLQILLDGRWVQTRMEMDAERNWYMDGTAVESAFVTFDKSNKTALTGMNTIYVPYPALFRECEVKK